MPPDSPLVQLFRQNFLLIQVALGIFLLLVGWIFFRPKRPESGFAVRESDLRKGQKPPTRGAIDRLARARVKPKATPPLLPGIRLDGEPHQILNVAKTATESEIQTAYRELIKRYHPDKIGRPDSREWKDAQKIAELLTQARAAMLAERRRR